MSIDEAFPTIMVVLGIIILVCIVVSIIRYHITTCNYYINEPIFIDMAKKLIDNGVKECDKEMCIFTIKIRKVKK